MKELYSTTLVSSYFDSQDKNVNKYQVKIDMYVYCVCITFMHER